MRPILIWEMIVVTFVADMIIVPWEEVRPMAAAYASIFQHCPLKQGQRSGYLHGINIFGRKNDKPWKKLENVIAEKVTFENAKLSILAPAAALYRGGRRPRRRGRHGPTRTICGTVSSTKRI